MKRGPNNPAKSNAGATSPESFATTCAGLSPQAGAIYRAVFAGGFYGATVVELCDALNLKIQSVSAQVSYLKKRGLLKSTASFRHANRVVVAETFYDVDRDGDETATDRSFCSPLRDGKGRKNAKRKRENENDDRRRGE